MNRPIAKRRIDWPLAAASFGIAIGLLLIGWAVVRGVTGDDVTNLPDAIESVSPAPDAVQVPAQTQVIVDLSEGYEGSLEIDGVAFATTRIGDLSGGDVEWGEQVEIPAGVVFEPGNGTLTFTPGPGIEIERFDDGVHTVKVVYWTVEDGDDDARSYSWSFNVV
ncbi:MAG: hypothetical protein ACRD0G_04115 [Acidimicrobiales bacterium]